MADGTRTMPFDDDYVKSPCVRACTLDPATDQCVGCLRTLDEIKAWGSLSADAKRALLADLERRQAARPDARWFSFTPRG